MSDPNEIVLEGWLEKIVYWLYVKFMNLTR